MCDYYEELADIEDMETLRKTARKQKPRPQETVEVAPVAN
jgi:hypothetical protein